jgi:hypothetical protein
MDRLKQQFFDLLEPFYFDKIHSHAINVSDTTFHNVIIHFKDIKDVYFFYQENNDKNPEANCFHSYALFSYKKKFILCHLEQGYGFYHTNLFAGDSISQLIDALNHKKDSINNILYSYQGSFPDRINYLNMSTYLEKHLLESKEENQQLFSKLITKIKL